MELKLQKTITAKIKLTLLIEPVWNWNTAGHEAVRELLTTFNRTSMELKHSNCDFCASADRALLIEPVWNWNSAWCPIVRVPSTFNRTSMELKRTLWGWYCYRRYTFNRTSMELKLVRMRMRLDLKRTFNRTSMELKRGFPKAYPRSQELSFNRTSMELKLMVPV